MKAHGSAEIYFLDPHDHQGLNQYLSQFSWWQPGDSLLEVKKIGDGNMNCTLLVLTAKECNFIVKQGRPWVEKYPAIAAPWGRTSFESLFYRLCSHPAQSPELASAMPKLLDDDEQNQIMVLEYLPHFESMMFLYQRQDYNLPNLQTFTLNLLKYLVHLHSSQVVQNFQRYFSVVDQQKMANKEMRQLNHEHIFVLPLREFQRQGKVDLNFQRQMERLGKIYLDESVMEKGGVLLHGDYYPGSWLINPAQEIKIIDPEFGFIGPKEFDLGVFAAHGVFCLASQGENYLDHLIQTYQKQGGSQVDSSLVKQFAGAEIFRRLLGVAQLPLTHSAEEKKHLIDLSIKWVTSSMVSLISLVFLIFFTACSFSNRYCPSKFTHPVWIDTDPSLGLKNRDVDDGLAIIQAINSPEIEVKGMSVTFGNAPLGEAYPVAQKLLERLKVPTMPLFSGAEGAKDLGHPTPAVEALAIFLKQRQGLNDPITILALGPLTNVASLLLLYPELKGVIKEIVVVAGRRPGQRFTTGTLNKKGHRDLNFELDPRAFEVILRSEIPVVMAPFEISSQVWIKEEDLQQIAKEGGRLGTYLASASRDWLKLWQETFAVDGFNPFDTLAVAYVTTPTILTCEEVSAEIQTLPDDLTEEKMQGQATKNKEYLLVSRKSRSSLSPSAKSIKYCYNVAPQFKQILINRLTHSMVK